MATSSHFHRGSSNGVDVGDRIGVFLTSTASVVEDWTASIFDRESTVVCSCERGVWTVAEASLDVDYGPD